MLTNCPTEAEAGAVAVAERCPQSRGQRRAGKPPAPARPRRRVRRPGRRRHRARTPPIRGQSRRYRSVPCGRPSARRFRTNLSAGIANASLLVTTRRSSPRPPRRSLPQRPRRGDRGPRPPRPADRGRRPPSRRRRAVTRPTRTSVSRRRRPTLIAMTSTAATSGSCHLTRTGSTATAMEWAAKAREVGCLPCHPISVGWLLIILLIIQTILLDPSGSVWSRLDRHGIQPEQARSVWSRPGRRRASVL
jgi:hypothetical protein